MEVSNKRGDVNGYYRIVQQIRIKEVQPLLTKFRTTVETAFYGKNMQEVTDMMEAYNLALNAKGVVVTDLPVRSILKKARLAE